MSDLSVGSQFFAPTSTDMLDGLVGQYRTERSKVEQVDQFLAGDGFACVVSYFLDGNQDRQQQRYQPDVSRLFKLDGAIAALNADFWSRAMRMTDVLDCMPSKRREEWFDQIRDMTTPDFEEDTVRATLGELLALRGRFLAERVDGIFQALSRTHVTNQPEGFGKRMILTGVTNDWGSYSRSQTGHINDMRGVIAKFMSRDEPDWNASNRMVEIARAEHRGEWLDVDGGAFRIRCYKNGNAHLEVHPDIAWRLNQILAHLYPAAIPSEFRTAPKKKAKSFTLMDRPLPFAVLNLLHRMNRVETRTIRGDFGGKVIEPDTTNPHSLRFEFGDHDKHALAEAERVLAAVGGVRCGSGYRTRWEFDYNAKPIINEIVVSGCVPDHKSYQYYPTPESLATKAVELAEISPDDQCLEPSAGTGGLADLMPKDRTTCVEISELHCSVLKAKGYYALRGDFLKIPELTGSAAFNRIVMNPPFDQGRWEAHVEAAATLVNPGGRLVAILPASAKNNFKLPGFACEYHGPYDNQFAGASVSVVILTASRAA